MDVRSAKPRTHPPRRAHASKEQNRCIATRAQRHTKLSHTRASTTPCGQVAPAGDPRETAGAAVIQFASGTFVDDQRTLGFISGGGCRRPSRVDDGAQMAVPGNQGVTAGGPASCLSTHGAQQVEATLCRAGRVMLWLPCESSGPQGGTRGSQRRRLPMEFRLGFIREPVIDARSDTAKWDSRSPSAQPGGAPSSDGGPLSWSSDGVRRRRHLQCLFLRPANRGGRKRILTQGGGVASWSPHRARGRAGPKACRYRRTLAAMPLRGRDRAVLQRLASAKRPPRLGAQALRSHPLRAFGGSQRSARHPLPRPGRGARELCDQRQLLGRRRGDAPPCLGVLAQARVISQHHRRWPSVEPRVGSAPRIKRAGRSAHSIAVWAQGACGEPPCAPSPFAASPAALELPPPVAKGAVAPRSASREVDAVRRGRARRCCGRSCRAWSAPHFPRGSRRRRLGLEARQGLRLRAGVGPDGARRAGRRHHALVQRWRQRPRAGVGEVGSPWAAPSCEPPHPAVDREHGGVRAEAPCRLPSSSASSGSALRPKGDRP